jgi:hypothetical protein
LLVAAYLIEAGILLIVAPWMRWWQHNVFVDLAPALAAVMANPFVRGGVTGIGLLTLLGGLRDLASAFFPRPAEVSSPPTEGPWS